MWYFMKVPFLINLAMFIINQYENILTVNSLSFRSRLNEGNTETSCLIDLVNPDIPRDRLELSLISYVLSGLKQDFL